MKIRSEYRELLEERNFLVKVYSIFDIVEGITTDYEGEIQRKGDAVFIRGALEQCLIVNEIPLHVFYASGSMELVDYNKALRLLYSKINWVDLKFFAATVINHKLLWGVL